MPRTSPERFGDYELVERLGIGGMAETFVATDAALVASSSTFASSESCRATSIDILRVPARNCDTPVIKDEIAPPCPPSPS